MADCHYALAVTRCTLTGRVCYCPDNPQHCVRRINADAYASKHPEWCNPTGAEDHVVGIVDLSPSRESS